MSYWDEQANQASWDRRNVELNGGIGSSEYYDALNREKAARDTAQRESSRLRQPPPWETSGTGSTISTGGLWFPSGSAARDAGPRHRHTSASVLLLILSFVVAAGAFQLVSFVMPPFPSIHHPPHAEGFRPTSGKGAPAEILNVRKMRIAQFKSTYGDLFAETMPWDELMPRCDSAPTQWACAQVSLGRLLAQKAHMRRPTSFTQEFCEATWKAEIQRWGGGDALPRLLRAWLEPYASLPPPTWKLSATPAGKAYRAPIQCAPANGPRIEMAAQALSERLVAIAAGSSLTLLIAGWLFSRRFRGYW